MLYGLAPAAVASRRARRTYGCGTSMPWSRSVYAGSRCMKQSYETSPGFFQPFADDVFDHFVFAGEEARAFHLTG